MEDKLREAACYGDMDGLLSMLNLGANVNAQHKINGYTALHWAAKRNNLQCVETLLAHGADKMIYASKGELPAHLTTNKKVLQTLGYAGNVRAKKAAEEKPIEPVKFVPNYLKHPPLAPKILIGPERQDSADSISKEFLPQKKQSNIKEQSNHANENAQEDKKTDQSVSDCANKVSQANNSVNTNAEALNEVRILKVRLVQSDGKDCEKDFIEMDLPVAQMSFRKLIETCSEEFSIDPNSIVKVRKLPNTKLRRDVEIQRLSDYQELEIEINPSALNLQNVNPK